MYLAFGLAATKAFWSLLVAAALIWSGVALTPISPSASAALSDARNWGETLIVVEEEKDRDDGTGSIGSRSERSIAPVPADSGNTPQFFDADADYRVLTRYGSPSEITLADFLSDGAAGITFGLSSCDENRADYYRSVAVTNGKLSLESNRLGHVHGSNTETETVCTLTAADGNENESRAFSLYTVSDRTPPALLPGAISLVEARPSEMDLSIALPGGSLGYLRLGWRMSGGSPNFAVVSGVSDNTGLTISGLQENASYEIRAYLMTAQAFDLYRASNSGPSGTLISEGNFDSKWISNLSGAGLGKSQSITVATLPEPSPEPNPVPTDTPEATLAPSPRPTPEDDDEDDDPDLDTPTPTDNDGTDSDGIDTPPPATPTPATLTPDTLTPDTPTPATPTPDTLTPATLTPDTPTPVTPTPDTPTPATPTPDTPTPDTLTPDTPTPDTPPTPPSQNDDSGDDDSGSS